MTSDLRCIAYGSGEWVAAGDGGTIVTSPDGTTWTTANSGTTQNLRNVAYGNSVWVAVGWNGTILTSPNGQTWTPRASGVTQNLQGIAYANNGWNGAFHAQWVAVGEGDTVLTSSDATTWSVGSTGSGNGLYGVVFNPNIDPVVTSPPGPGDQYFRGIFEAVGASGTITFSNLGTYNGVKQGWTSQPSGTGNGLNRIFANAFPDSNLVAVGNSGTVFFKSYGTGATTRTITIGGGLYFLSDVAGYQSHWLAVGASGFTATSPDGMNWTQVN